MVPDYTLSPLLPGQSWGGNSIKVTEPTLLSDLLQPGMGTCHWAACRTLDYPGAINWRTEQVIEEFYRRQ
jgi:hypothetical protein